MSNKTDALKASAAQAWSVEIKHGPDGEEDYAWLYRGKEMVATMRTHHAKSVCAAMEAALLGEQAAQPVARVRNEPIAYVCKADIRLLANQPNGTDMSIAPRPFPEYGMEFPLYAGPTEAPPVEQAPQPVDDGPLTVSFPVHQIAHNLLLAHTGQEGGCPKIDWYRLRSEISDAIAVALDDQRKRDTAPTPTEAPANIAAALASEPTE